MTIACQRIEELLGADAIAAVQESTCSATGLPAKVYFDADIFALECEQLFPRTWVAAGIASDIAEPGDTALAAVAGRNIILLRDKDRRVRAFYNACRHRGMQLLCKAEKGLRNIICPFHNWTYGLDGSLRGTPYLGGIGIHKLDGFEQENLGLLPVTVDEWCNTIFVNLDGHASPLKEHLAPLLSYLGGDHDWNTLYHHKAGSIFEETVEGNWKHYVEVSLEEYHLRFAHPWVFEGTDPLTWRPDPVIDRHLMGGQGQLSGSFGAGYKYYSGTPLPRWLDRGEKWTSYVTLLPNLGIWTSSDQVSIDFFLPTSADSYSYRQEFYFSGDVEPDTVHKGAIDAALNAWSRLAAEDNALLAGLRKNQYTNQFIDNRPRFAGKWEGVVHRFQQYYLNSLIR